MYVAWTWVDLGSSSTSMFIKRRTLKPEIYISIQVIHKLAGLILEYPRYIAL